MHPYIHILGRVIPAYGLMITIGILLANLIALGFLERKQLSTNNFILLEAYTLLGAFIGAKSLFLIICRKNIEWNRFFELEYFNALMKGGFVFYGGLIGGIIAAYIAGKIHKFNAVTYIRNVIFLIPLIHSFGRIGCFLSGCCYGIPYAGFGSVTFPEESFGLSNVSLFPVQLVEAICLIVISLIILLLMKTKNFYYTLEIYLGLYAVTRFVLERFRYDSVRGIYMGLSTSQWISIVLLLFSLFPIFR